MGGGAQSRCRVERRVNNVHLSIHLAWQDIAVCLPTCLLVPNLAVAIIHLSVFTGLRTCVSLSVIELRGKPYERG